MAKHCRDCRTGLAHCHGTVVHHLLRQPECTEEGCTDTAAALHTSSVDCDAVGCTCAATTAHTG